MKEIINKISLAVVMLLVNTTSVFADYFIPLGLEERPMVPVENDYTIAVIAFLGFINVILSISLISLFFFFKNIKRSKAFLFIQPILLFLLHFSFLEYGILSIIAPLLIVILTTYYFKDELPKVLVVQLINICFIMLLLFFETIIPITILITPWLIYTIVSIVNYSFFSEKFPDLKDKKLMVFLAPLFLLLFFYLIKSFLVGDFTFIILLPVSLVFLSFYIYYFKSNLKICLKAVLISFLIMLIVAVVFSNILNSFIAANPSYSDNF